MPRVSPSYAPYDFGLGLPGLLVPQRFLNPGNVATLNMTANQGRGCQFRVSEPLTLTQIAFEVTTADAADPTVDVGIYTAGGIRIASSGNTPGKCLTTGIKSVPLSAALVPGVTYYAILACSSATPGFRSSNAGSANIPALLSAALPNYFFGPSMPLPADISASLTNESGNVPLLALRTDDFPLTVSGLQAWYAADRLPLADGDAVSTWTDLSGNARHLTAGGALRPVLAANQQNGKPVVRFDGVDDGMSSSAFAVAQPNTMFCVARSRGAFSGASETIFGGTNGGIFRGAGDTNGRFVLFFGTSLNYSAADTTVAQVLSAVVNGASSSNFRNGTAAGSGNAGAAAWVNASMGFGAADVDIAEALLYSGALAAGDRISIERYLGQKYGIVVA
jgi:hypothetical protein